MPAGAASRSFTSTAVNVQTRNARTLVRIERHPKKKAYMKLHTSCGDLNLELHCDMAPRTCENFLVLSESGYYQDTVFHRCIKNFMIQVSIMCGHLTQKSQSSGRTSGIGTPCAPLETSGTLREWLRPGLLHHESHDPGQHLQTQLYMITHCAPDTALGDAPEHPHPNF